MSNTKLIFTSAEAAALFERHTRFFFHSSVPGTLLARRGVKKLPGNVRPSQFDGAHWHLVWNEMLALAHDRCSYDPGMAPPVPCSVPPLEPVGDGGVTAESPRAAEHESSRRWYIAVPFEEKDEAKALGARWDAVARSWFVPDGLRRADFRWPDANPDGDEG